MLDAGTPRDALEPEVLGLTKDVSDLDIQQVHLLLLAQTVLKDAQSVVHTIEEGDYDAALMMGTALVDHAGSLTRDLHMQARDHGSDDEEEEG